MAATKMVAKYLENVRAISKKILRDFYSNPKYSDSETAIEVWYKDALKSAWKTPADIKQKYGNASFIKENRVIFNIHGNKYRLVVKIHYNLQAIFIRFIGTHEQYDKINVEEI